MITHLELWITDVVSVSLVSINVWRLAGDTLNITCNFLYCSHRVHRDFLITLYFNCIITNYVFSYMFIFSEFHIQRNSVCRYVKHITFKKSCFSICKILRKLMFVHPHEKHAVPRVVCVPPEQCHPSMKAIPLAPLNLKGPCFTWLPGFARLSFW
jgi:hypothetical protein